MRRFCIGLLIALAGCTADETARTPGPGLDTEGSTASLALTALCRQQAEACAQHAAKHPCQLGDPSCMTANECNAQAMSCISAALNQ